MTRLDTAETEPEEETLFTADKPEVRPNLIGVTLRIHEGKQTSCPYSVHPKQLVIENTFMFCPNWLGGQNLDDLFTCDVVRVQ